MFASDGSGSSDYVLIPVLGSGSGSSISYSFDGSGSGSVYEDLTLSQAELVLGSGVSDVGYISSPSDVEQIVFEALTEEGDVFNIGGDLVLFASDGSGSADFVLIPVTGSSGSYTYDGSGSGSVQEDLTFSQVLSTLGSGSAYEVDSVTCQSDVE